MIVGYVWRRSTLRSHWSLWISDVTRLESVLTENVLLVIVPFHVFPGNVIVYMSEMTEMVLYHPSQSTLSKVITNEGLLWCINLISSPGRSLYINSVICLETLVVWSICIPDDSPLAANVHLCWPLTIS